MKGFNMENIFICGTLQKEFADYQSGDCELHNLLIIQFTQIPSNRLTDSRYSGSITFHPNS